MISGYFVQKQSSRNIAWIDSFCMAQTEASSSFLVRPFRVNDNALYPMNELDRPITAVLQRLRGFAPTAIENGVGGRDAGGGGRILAPHYGDENADCGSGVTAGERTNFNKSPGFAHLGAPAGRSAMLAWRCIDAADQGLVERGTKRNCRKIRLRVVALGTRYELNDVGVHDNSSDTAMTTRPTSASEIRQAVIGSLRKIKMCGMIAVQARIIWGANLIPSGAACGA